MTDTVGVPLVSTGPGGDFAALERATAELDPPFAVVDLAAFHANARDLRAPRGRRPDPAGVQVGALPGADRRRPWRCPGSRACSR